MKRHLYYIDLFAGAGGTSTGVELARIGDKKAATVIACVNHDKNAIASHFANHPHAMHFIEDIRTLQLSPIVQKIQTLRTKEPDAIIVLWASLECTNFSKAKGGKPRDTDSRSLAEHLYRYIETIDPDYIQIENVEEFMAWGDMDENGKPISMKKGCNYQKWVFQIQKYGYQYDYRILNAADFGAYTSRKRYFGIFAKHGFPISFPKPTHTKNPNRQDFFGNGLKRWKAVKDVLDFTDKGESIFTRKKDLSPNTYRRIHAGLIKFVAGGKDKWLLKYNSCNFKTKKHVPPGIDEPCPVITTQERLGIVQCSFLSKYYSGHDASKNITIDAPAHTIKCKDNHALVTFISNNYTNGGATSDIRKPSPAILTNPKNSLVFCQIHKDKIPVFLKSYHTGKGGIVHKSTDSKPLRDIKTFMQRYGIVDITMRMLRVSELKQIMGFPKDYVLIGTKTEQKRYIGNAVEVNMARVLCEAISLKINTK